MKKLFVLLFVLTSTLFASIGSISSFKGSVNIKRDTQTLVGKINLSIEKKDIISTRENSNAIIKFNDGTIISIGKNSTLNIKEYIYDQSNKKSAKTNFEFLKGSFKSVTGIIGKVNPSKFKLRTKTASIGIRGTVTLGNQEIVAVTKGSVSVSAQKKTVTVNAGQYVSTVAGKLSTANKLTNKIMSMLSSQLGTPSKSDGSSSSLESTVKAVQAATTQGGNNSKSGNESGGDSGGGGGHGH